MSLLNTDFSKPTCRVCLKNRLDEKMASIFDMDAEWYDLRIYEKLERCAGIKILCDSKLPAFICSLCNKLLKISYKFRTVCQNSEEYLKSILATEAIQLETEATEAKEEPLEENSSPGEENTSKETSSCMYKRNDSNSPLIEYTKEDENSISCSSADYSEPMKEFISDNESDVFIDIDDTDGEDILSCSENIDVSAKNMDLNMSDAINDTSLVKTPIKRKKRKPKNALLKTLEISKDGDAVIEKKKSRRKREDRKQPHVCEICGNVYNRRHVLEHHIKRHSDVKDFECEICGNAFHSDFELGRHMRKHTGLKPYKCSYCPKAFGDHSTLTKHERVHRNERPFKCDICGSCFSYPGVLKRHKLVHTGEKPYKCEICGKCFNDRYHLISHLKTIQHKDDPRVEMFVQKIKENNVNIT